jgi:hypothetical protein
MHRDGESLGHRKMPAGPAPLRKALAPYREDVVVCVACIVPWDWLAARGARAGLPFVLGHARSMLAIQGGTAQNDQSDAQNIAVLLRGGMLPQASGSPAERRAPRDLRWRRVPLTRKRAEWLAPIHNTHRQDNLPERGKKRASQAHRGGVAERVPAPAVHTRVAVDLALMAFDEQ